MWFQFLPEMVDKLRTLSTEADGVAVVVEHSSISWLLGVTEPKFNIKFMVPWKCVKLAISQLPTFNDHWPSISRVEDSGSGTEIKN